MAEKCRAWRRGHPSALVRGVAHLMAGLSPSRLDGCESVIVTGNGAVVLDPLLGTALLVDFHQGKRRGIVFNQAHLRRDRHDSGDWKEHGKGGGKRTGERRKPS